LGIDSKANAASGRRAMVDIATDVSEAASMSHLV
jgi:hypothetical protein